MSHIVELSKDYFPPSYFPDESYVIMYNKDKVFKADDQLIERIRHLSYLHTNLSYRMV